MPQRLRGYPFDAKGDAMTDFASGTAIDAGSAFRIGDVLGRSFSILGRNFVPFVILSGIASLPYLYLFWTLSVVSATPAASLSPAAAQKLIASFVLPIVVGASLKILTQAIIVNGAFQDMRDHKVSIGQSLSVGLARILPVLGLSICYIAGYLIGTLLLIVPGIIVLMMWYVAMPVCVVERLGPLKSLGRSRMLTKGHRWKLFGLLILVGFVGGAFPAFGQMIGGRVGFVIFQYLVQAVVGAFSAILVVVVYRDLRVAKEGIDTDRIASVFD
jgi:hypothetical protein